MINYSIDGSVYAYPFQERLPNVEELYDYCKIINDLHDVIIEKQPRHKKYFLFSRDIKLVNGIKELNFCEKEYSLFTQIVKDNLKKPILVKDAQDLLNEIWNRLLPYNLNSNSNEQNDNDVQDENKGDLSRHIIFEKWFNIENIVFKSSKDVSLISDTLKRINSIELRENTIKNIALIAALNRYVYLSSDNHHIIAGRQLLTETIPVAYSGALEHQLREHLNKNTKHLNSLPEMSPQYRKNSLHWGTEKKP